MSATNSADLAAPARKAIDRTVAELKDGVAAATDAYGTVSAHASATATELAGAMQGTLAALAESAQLFMTESQDVAQQMARSAQDAASEGMNTFRAMAGVRSMREGLEMQANFLRTIAIWSVNEQARFARAGIDMAEKVSAPLLARTLETAGKFGNRAA